MVLYLQQIPELSKILILRNTQKGNFMKYWKKNAITEETTKEYKYISLMTYATEEEICKVLEEKKPYIKAVSYIFHNKETAEPHTHIALELKRSRKGQAILRWFKGLKDSKGQTANTLAEEVISVSALHDYFTHSDSQSIQNGKHQYTEEDIKTIAGLDHAWDYMTAWEKAEEQAEAKEQKADETEQLLQDILDEVPQREMCRRYGRDYMKNYQQYKNFASLVVLEETGDFERALRMRDSLEKSQIREAQQLAMERTLKFAWETIMESFETEKKPTLENVRKRLGVDEKGDIIKYEY